MKALPLALALVACGRTVPWSPAAPVDAGAVVVDAALAQVVDAPDLSQTSDAAPPEEECNGRDDDGDGLVDEKCVKPLAHDITSVKSARIEGDTVVIDRWWAFEVMDLVSGTTTHIEEPKVDGGTQLYATDADLRGGWLSWRGVDKDQVKGYLLRARHLPTGRELARSDPRIKDFGPSQIDNGRVVFTGKTDGPDFDVWVWDTATDELRMIGYPGAFESVPDIAGSLVVWERRETVNGPSELRLYDLETNQLRAPSDGLSGSHLWPAIDGGRVVWRREWSDPAHPDRIFKEFWLYDSSTEERRRIGETNDAGYARIDGDRLCWIESRYARPSAWVHDLSTGRSLRVSTRAHQCDRSGRRVVLLEYDYQARLFLRELLPDEP